MAWALIVLSEKQSQEGSTSRYEKSGKMMVIIDFVLSKRTSWAYCKSET